MSSISSHDAVERSREFWRGALRAGTFTSLPRQSSTEMGATVGKYEARIPDELVAKLRRLADEMTLPVHSVLLTAHAKVLSALSGEREVSTGYVAMEGRSPLLCRMTTEPGSWRAMMLQTHRAQLELLEHSDFPVEDISREPRPGKPLFETVFDPTADGRGELADDTVLWLGVLAFDGAQATPTLRLRSGSPRACRGASESRGVRRDGIMFRLRYRSDVIEPECAARIAGYHLTALAFIAADPDAEHERQSLVSADELQFQINGLAGPRRKLPDLRVHELFEEQVRAHADAVAAVQGATQWTYRQLNARANRLARALLAHGVCREGVVAVVAERNLEWMAAVLAIFKAGGAYLPIEPHFPADRIAKMLSRAECRLVLTERGSTTMLEHALASLSGVQTLYIDAACDAGAADEDVGIRVASDQLAYIYFTSGSSGEPKGVMCEHGGLLNHLFAKIHDLGIGEGDVVAQTAPQCFDISLWQLVSALLVGGRTLLIEQEAVLDARRFIDTIVDGKAAVVQVVPSYLEVLLSCLSQDPRELPDLRCVLVTGEALKKELVQRWFATQPAITLVNAYGLTETSDDTNHEMMDRVPDRERVPLGRPVNNVYVYVVDQHLSLVPLGAPGELVFSGVCVGRGYVNDPERTRRAFMADPYREGHRLYRSGDYGRWLTDGKLEFLGRRDTQVKISGFRIEIGEIENRLLGLPGIRDAAVVVTEGADRTRRLVAFYCGEHPLDANLLRDSLSESLPDYMVPSAFHWRTNLALTDNGKIDRKALTALAGELDVAGKEHDGPRTVTEQWLAAAWAHVLGISKDQIGRRDHFFDLGGTSLSALKLAIALDRAVSFRDLRDHPILADLAALVDHRLGPGVRAGSSRTAVTERNLRCRPHP